MVNKLKVLAILSETEVLFLAVVPFIIFGICVGYQPNIRQPKLIIL
jgi:hypothetical protein